MAALWDHFGDEPFERGNLDAGRLSWLFGREVVAVDDPFDPETVENSRPTVKFFVGAVDPGDSLNATSYNETRFSWSGTDRDGFVTEFYVSIRTNVDEPAPWATTIKTDTTMSFSDFEGDDAKAADAARKQLADSLGAADEIFTVARFFLNDEMTLVGTETISGIRADQTPERIR